MCSLKRERKHSVCADTESRITSSGDTETNLKKRSLSGAKVSSSKHRDKMKNKSSDCKQ